MSNYGKIGSYRVIDRIAEGGMAEVFLAVSQGVGNVNKFVAIKRMLNKHSRHQDLTQMFKDEAQVAIHLRHHNIVTVYDFKEEDNQYYLVMEYVDGKTVSRFRQELFQKKTQLPIQFILYIMRETAAGLSYAHQFKDLQSGQPMNLIHRDLSPHNILVGSGGDVKIIDFGIAKSDLSSSKTNYGVIKGKLAYLSPEQVLYQPIDQRADLFSMGVMMWELLTTQRLFNLTDQAAYFAMLRDFKMPDPRPLNPKIDDTIFEILSKILQKDPNDRYASAQEVYRDLNYYLNSVYPGCSMDSFATYLKENLPEWGDICKRKLDGLKEQEKTQVINHASGEIYVFRLKRTFKVVQQ